MNKIITRKVCLTRVIVVNRILNKIKGKTYLEIGVNKGTTFEKIEVKNKIGVDPIIPAAERVKNILNKNIKYFQKTSNEFFSSKDKEIFKNNKIDVAFIDGLHEYKQVIRDVESCLDNLNERGVLVLHDCNPLSKCNAICGPTLKEAQINAKNLGFSQGTGPWLGDVWKAIAHLRSKRDDLNIFVLDCDSGLGIITKGTPENMLNYSIEDIEKMEYEDLEKDRKKILNLKYPKFFLNFLKRFD